MCSSDLCRQATFNDARLGRHATSLARCCRQGPVGTHCLRRLHFDHVDHNVLVYKLVALGLPDVIVRWICAFLRHRRQRVKIGDGDGVDRQTVCLETDGSVHSV